jgi:general stress protein YciG
VRIKLDSFLNKLTTNVQSNEGKRCLERIFPMTKLDETAGNPQVISAIDFLKSLETDETAKNDNSNLKTRRSRKSAEKPDYHVRAGRIGGQTTKQRHRDSNFYKEIGAKGGATTMARHSEEYEERRKKGGETTRARYGEEYYHEIAAKAARTKQEATKVRNDAIKALLDEGLKIPTIIKMKLEDLQQSHLQKFLQDGPVAEYLRERTNSDTDLLFVSQTGKPLSLANTYTIMERHRA